MLGTGLQGQRFALYNIQGRRDLGVAVISRAPLKTRVRDFYPRSIKPFYFSRNRKNQNGGATKMADFHENAEAKFGKKRGGSSAIDRRGWGWGRRSDRWTELRHWVVIASSTTLAAGDVIAPGGGRRDQLGQLSRLLPCEKRNADKV